MKTECENKLFTLHVTSDEYKEYKNRNRFFFAMALADHKTCNFTELSEEYFIRMYYDLGKIVDKGVLDEKDIEYYTRQTNKLTEKFNLMARQYKRFLVAARKKFGTDLKPCVLELDAKRTTTHSPTTKVK